MKHTTIQVPSNVKSPRTFPIPAVMPEVHCKFGMMAIILPRANHDLESFTTIGDDERQALDDYHTNLARFLYAQMGGHDLDLLRKALNNLPR